MNKLQKLVGRDLREAATVAKIRALRDLLNFGKISEYELYHKLMEPPKIQPIVYELGLRILYEKLDTIDKLYMYSNARRVFRCTELELVDTISTYASQFSKDLISKIDLTGEGSCKTDIIKSKPLKNKTEAADELISSGTIGDNDVSKVLANNMQEWLDNYKAPVCECGADKAELTIYEHSTWCPMFIAPVPITDRCNCGVGSWHSPGCKNRVWPEEPINELKKVQEYMKNIVDKLNDNK